MRKLKSFLYFITNKKPKRFSVQQIKNKMTYNNVADIDAEINRLTQLREVMANNPGMTVTPNAVIMKLDTSEKFEPLTDMDYQDMKERDKKVKEEGYKLEEQGHTCIYYMESYPRQLGWCQQTPCKESTDIAKLKNRD